MANILVVGAGFSGAVIARTLADYGWSVDLIEARGHVGGNAHDVVNSHGIRVHSYGPHLFHTSNTTVVEWLSKFTDWVPYKHRVKALLHDGEYATLPVNKKTSEIVGPDNVMNIFFRPYTKKMWGYDLEDLDASVFNRIPIRDDENEFYFPKDTFQALPKNGYENLFISILDHKNINISLNTPFEKKMESGYFHIFNSMPIDEYFDFSMGELPYRSIKFHHFDLPMPSILPVATVNFTHNYPYTRVTEWNKLPGNNSSDGFSTLTFEEPCDYKENNFQRFYPVKDLDGKNLEKYRMYRNLVSSKMTFIGRCGMYAYLDMHQAISTSLHIAENFICHNSQCRN